MHPALIRMVRRLVPGASVLFVLLSAFSHLARADLIYEQPADFPASSRSALTSSFDASGLGFRTFDNFTLSQGAAITGVNWQGLYYDQIAPSNNPIGPQTTSWKLGFYPDQAGQPGTALQNQVLAATSVVTQFAGTRSFEGSTVNVYNFHADLPTSFLAMPGITYWFSPLSLQASGDTLFAWMSGAGPDGISSQKDSFGITSLFPEDRAFSLEAATPEPGAWTLAALGIGGLMYLRRRWPLKQGSATA